MPGILGVEFCGPSAVIRSLLAEGRPGLYPETPAQLIGWKREIEETPWLITQVTHDLSDTAYTNALEMEIHQGGESS